MASPVVTGYLRKRQNYYWALAGGASGFLITLAGISGAYAANKCTADLGSTSCWVGAAVALVAGALGGVATTAASIAGAAASAAAAAKRSTGYIDTIAGLDFHSSSLSNLTAINTTMQTVGLVLLGAFDYMNTSKIDGLEKREQNNTVTEMQHVLYFGSQFGLHVATHMRNNVTELVNSIIGVETPGSLPDTLSGAHSLQRRVNYFDVNWISWNWDNAPPWEEDDQCMFGWFANNPGWKYYWSVTDNPDPGYKENYSDIGDENAVHGELYFNTYGGLMASVMTTKMVLNAKRQLVVIDTIVVTAICDYVMKYWKKKVNLTTISLYLMLKL
ncbi:AIS_HP2_G0016790.mRNA.1.CDS.1 [Saccharomyces cerevisiae]|nr:AIS_HP2_G0016790.mRNA.1.CDS.1 [Saccharomyces cerevisiae]CAI6493386.1 AIS_HP2_G0016790.mRNA.1.CDS.1 [Saccharomyces cerevisiae]